MLDVWTQCSFCVCICTCCISPPPRICYWYFYICIKAYHPDNSTIYVNMTIQKPLCLYPYLSCCCWQALLSKVGFIKQMSTTFILIIDNDTADYWGDGMKWWSGSYFSTDWRQLNSWYIGKIFLSFNCCLLTVLGGRWI